MAVLVIALLAARAEASTAYTAAASGNWSNPATWTPNTGFPPGQVSGDSVTINSSVTVTMDYAMGNDLVGFANSGTLSYAAGGALRLGAGTNINNPGAAMNVTTGSLVLTGATLTSSASSQILLSNTTVSGSGTIVCNSGCVMNIGDGVTLTGFTINSTGTINLTASVSLTMGNGQAININGGSFDARNNATFVYSGGAFPSVNVASGGTFKKTTTIGTTSFNNVRLNNDGTVDAQQGTIDIPIGTSSGLFTANAPQSVDFSSVPHTVNGASVGGTGVRLNGGTIASGGGLTVLSGATFTWSSGSMGDNFGGTTTIDSGGTLLISGGVTQNGRTISNNGTINFNSGGVTYSLISGATINNNINGLFNDQNAANTLIKFNGGGVTAFNNAGTLRKSGGGTTTFEGGGSMPLNNSGTVEALNGTLAVMMGTSTGLFTATAPGVVSFPAGSVHTMNGATIGGNGNVHLNGGTVTGPSLIIPNTGTLTWSSGWMGNNTGGTTTINSGGTLLISGMVTLDGRTISNSGTVNFNSGGAQFSLVSGSTFSNNINGLFDDQNTANALIKYNGGGVTTFNNAGTLRKSGSGTTSFEGGGAMLLNNTGTVEALNGTLAVMFGTSTGLFTATAPGVVSFPLGSIHTMNGATVGGTGNVHLNGGTIIGPSFVIPNMATLTWSSGSMGNNTGGTTTINSGGTVLISGFVTLDGRTISNDGTVNFASGGAQFSLISGGTFNNNATGLFNDQNSANALIKYNGGATAVFNNAGVLRKSGSGATSFEGGGSMLLNNTGTVEALNGTWYVMHGTSTGLFTATAPGVVSFFPGSIHTMNGATVGGTGNVHLNGGTIIGPSFIIPSGATLSWLSGTMGGGVTDVTTIAAGGTLLINGPASLNFRIIDNFGTVTFASSGDPLTLISGATFNNKSGGLFDARNAANTLIQYGGGALPAFNNAGLFTKTTTATGITTTTGFPFNNTGTVNGQTGILRIGQGTSSGTFTATAPASVEFSGSTHTMNGASISGDGVMLNGATLDGPAMTIISGGIMTWSSGIMQGSSTTELTTVASGGALKVTGAVNLINRTLSNNGTVLFNSAGGQFSLTSSAIFNNNSTGVFDDQSSANAAIAYAGGPVTTFNNTGVFRKSAAAGTTTSIPNMAFNNSGTIDLQIGALQIGAPTFNGSTILNFWINGITPLNDYGRLIVPGAVAFNGTIDVDVPGPYSPLEGDQFAVITYGSHSGTLAESLAFETSRTFTTTYNPTNLTLTASCTPPSPNVSADATSFCTGDSVTLTSSPTGGTAPYTYQWYEGATLLGGETAANLVVTAGGNYSVIVSDSVACDAQSPATTITENPAAVVSISGPASVCPNVSFSLDAGAGFTGYAWSTGQTSQIISVSQVVSTTYNVTVTNASGCQATDSHVVAITANPDATISAPASVPPNATGNIASAPVQGGASYAWTIANGTITGGQGTHSITFDAPGGGVINLQLTVTISGCSAAGAASVLTEETDIAIAKTAAATVQAGASLVYTIDVANLGSYPSTGVTVVDSLPPGTSLESINPGPWDCSEFGNDVTCFSDLAPETSSGFTLTVTAPQQPGTITNEVLVISANDSNSANNFASATTTVTAPTNCATVPPALLTPADNATELTSPVTFGWSEVEGALSYEVWLITEGAPSLLDTTTATTLTAGVPSGAARWFVIARLPVGCSPLVSTERSFTVPTSESPCASRFVASPIAPSSNSIVNTSSITFRWNPALNADAYRVWAAIDGAAPAVFGTTGETSLRAHIEKGDVLWWIEALYDGCASTESQRFHFTIPPKQSCGNARPELIGPATGANVTDGSVTFFWHGVADAVGYEVYLAAGSGTPVLIGNTNAATTSLSHLVPPGELEWTVLANFDRCPSRESQKSSFTFTPPADCIDHQRAILVSPLDDTVTISPALFSWNAVAGATQYELYIVSETNGPVRIATTTATSLSGVQLANSNVRWFVRVHFSEPCAPLDSEERELEVVALPAACGELEAPVIAAPGQISSGVPFLVQWTPSIGATHYELEISANSDFADAELITTSATQQELVRTNDGASPLSLFARVRAIDARCTPNPTISLDGPVSAIFILPTGGANGTAAAGSGGTISFTIPLDAQFAGQSFTAEPGAPWLSVSPSSGVVGASGTLLTATADTTSLPIGASLGSVTVAFTTLDSGSVQTQGTTLSIPTISISLVTPVTPTLNTTPPPDALIIPAVAHANGINTTFQSDVRVSNTSPKLLKYRLTFTPSGSTGITSGRQTTFSVEPGHTIALDDILASWFGTGESSAIGMLEIRPLTETTTSTSSVSRTGLANLVTFASSRTFNVSPNGTFGQYIPAIPFANFLGRALDPSKPALLSLQQIAQSDRYRTNLGLVEASGEPASLLVRVFGSLGEQLTAFPVNLAGGEHTQLNAFLSQQGINSLSDGRVEIEVLSAGGKVTAYASVLDNDTNDSLLVTPVTINDTGASHWVIPGVADLNNGFANWQTDMRVFNAGTEDADATLSFYSQNGGEPRTASINIPAGRVRQFDKSLASLFNVTNDGGAIHIDTGSAARLITTARTYNETTSGTFGQFISAITPLEAAGLESRPLQLLQVEESSRYRSNIGLAEVTGNPVKLEISIVPPDAKLTAITELTLAPNEFRQIGSMLKAVGLDETFNARVSIRVIEGSGRVTAYVSVIDAITNDPTYLPAQ